MYIQQGFLICFLGLVSATTVLKHNSVLHESYVEKYAFYNDFQDVYASLIQGKKVEELDYHVHNNFLYHLGKLCIPQGERVNVIMEPHTSLIVRHFGVRKHCHVFRGIVIGLVCLKMCLISLKVVHYVQLVSLEIGS